MYLYYGYLISYRLYFCLLLWLMPSPKLPLMQRPMLKPLLGTTDTTAIPDTMVDGEDITAEDGVDTTDGEDTPTLTDTGREMPNPLCCTPDTTDTTQPPSTTELLDTHMPTIP